MAKRYLLTLLILVSASAVAASAAGPKDYDRLYSECLKRSGGATNASVAACAEDVSDQAKAEMTSLYKAVYERLRQEDPSNAAKLEKAQRAWLVYRNQHCKLAGQYVGSPMYAYCPMELNILRVSELRELAGE